MTEVIILYKVVKWKCEFHLACAMALLRGYDLKNRLVKNGKDSIFLNKEQQWALQFFKFKIIYFLYPLSVRHILLLQTTLNVFQYFSRLHQGFTFRPITMRIFRYDESIRRSKSAWPFYETSSYVNRSWKPPSRRFEFLAGFSPQAWLPPLMLK